MALGPKQMGEAIVRNLKNKTGKSIKEWIEIVEQTKLKEKKEIIAFLKNENRLGHFQAQKIFEHFSGKDKYEAPSTFADKIFTSKKSKELYLFVKSKILEMETDIRIQPCQTYIPFYRKNQFAILTKSKNDEILLGLNLPEDYENTKFSKSSNKGSIRINAQTLINKKKDFDQEIISAILIAYQNN
ncbi:DUF5655 domain-containing protein [uncultured Aquimarina sp.]|uniref:DUF5655 domain-containing protein n=1 Tax=uncultured Aquimarina sp. TaxID=575652 RepID=UPI0026074456|nr:DUF5655 domain-containing protein [uncultured Aquimarina sp.]